MRHKNNKKERLDDLIKAATIIFIRKGYRQAQISEIAVEMGVAPGTVYLYVAGKEALFNLLIRRHFFGLDLEEELEFPLPEDEPGRNLVLMREQLPSLFNFPALNKALQEPAPKDPAGELSLILAEIYDVLHGYRCGLKLIEKSALDWPELTDFLYLDFRRLLMNELKRYIETRTSEKAFGPVESAEAGARLLLNGLLSFAVHNQFEIYPDSFDDADGRETVIRLLTRAFCSQ